jgi:hypothetical protein
MTFTMPDFATGPGRQFKISASDIAGRNSPFSCPIGLALKARNETGSARPNTNSSWRPRFDPASALNFAINGGYCGLVNGLPIAQIIDSERNLTHSQRRFLRHALETLQDLMPLAAADAGVEYVLGDEVSTRAGNAAFGGQVTVWAPHLRTANGAVTRRSVCATSRYGLSPTTASTGQRWRQ